MYKEVFRRNEQKYLLSMRQKKRLLRLIEAEVMPDRYFESTNCSLYFDTPNNQLIIKSIDKLVFKQKVRLRSYGVPSLEDKVFLESKVKYGGIVYKRRAQVGLAEFWRYYEGLPYVAEAEGRVAGVGQEGSKQSSEVGAKADGAGRSSPLVSSQITRELDYLFRHYRLRPAWLICYDRHSYVSRTDPSLRITFDEGLRSRTEDLRLEAGDYGQNYFTEKTCVMEIKVLEAMPMWLVKALSELKIYPVSFTKYGKIYEQARKEILC